MGMHMYENLYICKKLCVNIHIHLYMFIGVNPQAPAGAYPHTHTIVCLGAAIGRPHVYVRTFQTFKAVARHPGWYAEPARCTVYIHCMTLWWSRDARKNFSRM